MQFGCDGSTGTVPDGTVPDNGEDASDQVSAAQAIPDLPGLDDDLQPDRPSAIPVTVIAHCRHFGASVAGTQLFTPQFGQSECGSDTSPQFSQHAAAPQAGTSS